MLVLDVLGCVVFANFFRSRNIFFHQERISLPLQTLCLAIFDAIQLHMLHTSGVPEWPQIKQDIIEAINIKKVPRTLQILLTTYADADVLCLQECSGATVAALSASPLNETHHLVTPNLQNDKRGQNSLLLLRKDIFGAPEDLTQTTLENLEDPGSVSAGASR